MKEHGHLGCVGVLETMAQWFNLVPKSPLWLKLSGWWVNMMVGGVGLFIMEFLALIAHESGPSAVTGATASRAASMMHGRRGPRVRAKHCSAIVAGRVPGTAGHILDPCPEVPSTLHRPLTHAKRKH